MCIMGYSSTFTKFRDNSRCLSVNNHELSQQSIKNLSVHLAASRCWVVRGDTQTSGPWTSEWTSGADTCAVAPMTLELT